MLKFCCRFFLLICPRHHDIESKPRKTRSKSHSKSCPFCKPKFKFVHQRIRNICARNEFQIMLLFLLVTLLSCFETCLFPQGTNPFSCCTNQIWPLRNSSNFPFCCYHFLSRCLHFVVSSSSSVWILEINSHLVLFSPLSTLLSSFLNHL